MTARTGPTSSGLPTSVAAIPPGMFISLGRLAAHAGFASIGELLAAVDEGEAPSLPFLHRMAGERHADVLEAQRWLDELVRLRDVAPERAAARAEREAQELRARQQRAYEREQQAIAYSREQQAMRHQLEAERIAAREAREKVEAERVVPPARPGIGS